MSSKTRLDQLKIRVCSSCLALYLNNSWQPGKDISKHLENILRQRAVSGTKHVSFSIGNMDCIIDDIRKKEKSIKAEIVIKGAGRDNKTKKHISMPLSIAYDQCTNCSRLRSGYYEGILQLRNKSNSCFDAMVDEVIKRVDLARSAMIVKSIKANDGIDIYLTSKRLLQAIGKMLVENYGGVLKTSSSLFGRDRQTSKEIYRVTVMFRLPDFSRGDIMILSKRPVLLSNIKKSRVIGIDLMTHKRVSAESKRIEHIIAGERIKKTPVSKTRPLLEVIHPRTFQSTAVENPADIKTKYASVVEIDNKLYLVPS